MILFGGKYMATTKQTENYATAKVFVTAFRALSEDERRRVIELLLKNEDLRDQVEGALLWEERKDGSYRNFREYLKDQA
jgi:hypothetical protein